MAAYNKEFMKEAIRIALDNVKNGTGGPFGAVVVRDGKIIADRSCRGECHTKGL